MMLGYKYKSPTMVSTLNRRSVQQAIEDVDERHRRYVELNVQESCINLYANPVVQKKQAADSLPRIHGWVYDVATGFLKRLDIDFKVSVCVCVILAFPPQLFNRSQ